MRTEKNLIRIGSSLAVIIPRALAKTAGFTAGGRVRLESAGTIIRMSVSPRLEPVTLRGIAVPRGASWEDFRGARRKFSGEWSRRWKRS